MSDVTVNGWEKYVTEVGDILYTESDYQGKVHCAIVIGFHQYNSYTRYVTLFMVQQAYCGLIYSPERYKVEWAKFTVYTPSGQTVERFNKITPVEDHFSKHLVFERFKK